MPRYDYRCSACGLVYEKREGFDAPSVQECPTCQSQARRVLTPPAIVFKGSGWYVNDSRKGGDAGESTTKSEEKGEVKADAILGAVRDAGGVVEWKPEVSRYQTVNRQHVNITEAGPTVFSNPRPNPVPRRQRINGTQP